MLRRYTASNAGKKITIVLVALCSCVVLGLAVVAIAQDPTPAPQQGGHGEAADSDIYAYPGTSHSKDGRTVWEAPYTGSGWGKARLGDGGNIGDLDEAGPLDGESGGEE